MVTAAHLATASRPIPARAGIGLRSAHHAEFLERRPPVPWVEVHSENFFADGGRQLELLDSVRRDYGVSLHGVGLSLGSADPLDPEHLRRLRRLADRVQPALLSEHLSWSSAGGVFLNDLLPLPRTREALDHVVRRVTAVQEYLGRRILVENVSSYLELPDAEFTEWEFLAEVGRRAGCGLLFDVNNIYVNACNHGFDPLDYIKGIPAALVGEIHLAGHTVRGDLLIDTHSAPVCEPVWRLYEAAVRHLGAVPALIEWDAELPSLDRLLQEAQQADEAAGRAATAGAGSRARAR